MDPNSRRWPAALALSLVLAFAATGAAQDEDADPALKHARATFHTFAKAAAQAKNDAEKMKRAMACLDLSELDDADRERLGRECVVQLERVLGEVRHIPLNLIPEDPKGDAFVLYHDESGAGELVIDRVGRNWLYTAETVEALPGLFKVVEGRRAAREAVKSGGKPPPPVKVPETAAPPKAQPGYEHIHDWLRAHAPPSLRGKAFLLEYWQWLGLAALAALGVFIHMLVVVLLTAGIVQALKRQEMDADKALTKNGVRPFGLLVMAAFWWVGLGWLGLNPDVLKFVAITVKTVAAFAGVWGAYRLVDVVCNALDRKAQTSESKFDDLLVPLVRKSLKVFVVAFGVVIIADTLNFSIKSLLAGLGLGGLAFALAAQDTVKNFFGSLTVVLDRPFEVGDWVLIDKVEGSVEEVGFRSTRIRTFHNSLITLPNAKLLTAVVDNMGRRQYRRWTTKLGVAYHSTPEQLEALTEGIRELIRVHPYTRKDYFMCYVTGLADSSIEILIYAFFETPDWGRELRERQRLILDILRLCEALNVEIAFPTQTLNLVNVPEAEAAERAAEDSVRAKSSEQAQDVGRIVAQRILAPGARATARLAALEKVADAMRDEEVIKEAEAKSRGSADSESGEAGAGEAGEGGGGGEG